MPDMCFSVGTAAAPPGLMTLPLTSQQVFGSTCRRSAVDEEEEEEEEEGWRWLCVSPSALGNDGEAVRSPPHHH